MAPMPPPFKNIAMTLFVWSGFVHRQVGVDEIGGQEEGKPLGRHRLKLAYRQRATGMAGIAVGF